MIDREKRLLFVGITKSKTAISDSFQDLVSEAPCESIVIYGQGAKKNDFPEKLNTYKVDVLGKFGLVFLISFFSVLWKVFVKVRNTELVMVAYSTLPVNWLIALILRPKVFYFWSHDPTPHTGESFYNAKILPLDFYICTKFLGGKVLCGSQFVKKTLSEISPGLKVENLSFPYISALVDARFSEEQLERDIDVIFFGRMEEYKGIKILIDSLYLLESAKAFGLSERETLPLSIVFAGKGPLLQFVKNQSFNRQIRLEVVDFPTNEELKKLLLRSRYCCLPYLDGTGSQVMQSALALGCHIICSDIQIFIDIAKLIPGDYINFFSSGNSAELANLLNKLLSNNNWNHDQEKLISLARDRFSPAAWSQMVLKKCEF